MCVLPLERHSETVARRVCGSEWESAPLGKAGGGNVIFQNLLGHLTYLY